MFRRQPDARWSSDRGLRRRDRLLVLRGKPLLRLTEADFLAIVPQQMRTAMRVGADDTGRTWWMYRDELYVTDEALTADDAVALAEADSRRRRRRLDHAHALRHLESAPPRRTVIPIDVRNAVWRRDQGRCVVCGSQRDLEFDHLIPVALGGGNSERNLQLLCGACNRRKGASLG